MKATCTIVIDFSVTHLVSAESEDCQWAEQEAKFLVHPRFLREAGKEAKGDEILKLFLQTWRLVRDLVGKRVAEVARLVETEERVVNSEMLDMPESLKNRILTLKEA
ncbi:hypothetical protein WN944_029497 [Citrus x changshan-huyou]|uniref:Uncharacterized protein n=1 Tax=Citrus x changshan-huyou TaxID=2935761 RepID=A0AAP0LPQ8_9ROSI